ncbi:sulfatase-like hydrolase/transferase [Nocardia seriolae]|uniref:sulfatase-like hydrolase/transferase n=1 Tax=Nocardia seriolae TaxID=37332 RepID=UPI0009FA3AE6|nr:sulfatase-like hydrolase/transferase [Nocardia seriolae]PSK28849.1 sulfatase [Nocardia seriolae]QOW35398.1 sulfatase-like hydrolase/transferase [Nocardia seriolae]QUN17131.1 sulfatase-like hydrolase/transferase [Nocardia seriolae]WNJ62697.1 sulfatase-like hydrolase/transferase [Nocardia seriolae]
MISRRGFFGTGAMAGATAAAVAAAGPAAATPSRLDNRRDKPNILVVIVDEMRAPMWFPEQAVLDTILPNIAALRNKSVSFEQHYTAANDCTPSRGALLTGLYSHHAGVLSTSQSELAAAFPTWGTMLREQGYRTSWWGKWHLGHYADTTPGGLDRYGFDGGTYPSPNGAPEQGLQMDGRIVDQFVDWFNNDAAQGPWCTTVSLVNPHDIQWWPRWTRRTLAQYDIPRWINDLPGNFETIEQLSRKPRLQKALVEVSAVTFGLAPYGTPGADQEWIDLRNLYLWFQQQVDLQIGRVLTELAAQPEVAANTVVVFTSDHGDYAGSHGLHGKGGGAYDEAIRVPLFVHDPRGLLTPQPGTREQLTFSIDIAALLLTIGTGGSGWRSDDRYAHLAGRHDIATLARDPGAAGRPWVLHTTDEHSIEEAAVRFNDDAPGHVIALRTTDAKFVRYSHWLPGSPQIDTAQPEEYELYDYSTRDGQLELDNTAAIGGGLRDTMSRLHDQAIETELHQPLPSYLRQAQQDGWNDYNTQTAKPFGEQLSDFLRDGIGAK